MLYQYLSRAFHALLSVAMLNKALRQIYCFQWNCTPIMNANAINFAAVQSVVNKNDGGLADCPLQWVSLGYCL